MRLFISAFTACIIVFPIYLIAAAISRNPKKRAAEVERLKNLAIERGHVVTAEFISSRASYYRSYSGINDVGRMCIYEYYYKGRRYKFRFRDDNPTPTKTLYFVNNPKKATVAGALMDSKVSWPVVFLVVTVLVYLINCA